MTPDSPPARRAFRRLRVPAFYPVPTRTRRDGRTVERQADFLGMLAETGPVIGACEAVGSGAMASATIGTIRGKRATLGARLRIVTAPPPRRSGETPDHLISSGGYSGEDV